MVARRAHMNRPEMTPGECAFCGAEGHPHRLGGWTYARLRMNDGSDAEGWLCPACNPDADADDWTDEDEDEADGER